MVDNAERAIGEAARATDAEVAEYTVAPVFMEADTKGPTSGSWSSKGEPADMALFAAELDGALRRLNSDYDAKRSGDTTLYAPRIETLPPARSTAGWPRAASSADKTRYRVCRRRAITWRHCTRWCVTHKTTDMYIAISGNIGSGKTSLVEMLSSRLGYEPFFERIDNPYLDSFYQDMARWSFNLQMSFLSKKTLQVKEIMDSKNDIIQDRTIFEEAYVFVRNLNRMGLMSTQDYELYMTFFDLLAAGIRRPDIIVYLKASIPTLISQIRRRGREYEMGIQPEYLEGLNELYDDWIAGYDGRVIIVDVDRYDFVLSADHFDIITEKIVSEINK